MTTATRRWTAIIRLGLAGGVLVVLVSRLGAGPFLSAFDRLSIGSLVAALVITAVTTLCCAWRWAWIARRLGMQLDVRAAMPAYYRSQLLNQVLPAGVLGDVDRAVRHGEDQAAIGRATRAVVWERAAGMLGLLALAAAAFAWLPTGLRTEVARLSLIGVMAVAVAGVLAAAGLSRRRAVRRVTVSMAADLRRLSSGRGPWLPVLLSVVAASGHLLVLLVALRAAHVELPLSHAVPLLLVVLVASSLPTNIAGWGPREGAAAWVFGATGIGAAEGVTVATVYGLLSLVAAAPGALVILLDVVPRRIGSHPA